MNANEELHDNNQEVPAGDSDQDDGMDIEKLEVDAEGNPIENMDLGSE